MNISDLTDILKSDSLKERFNEIYADPAIYEKQKQR